MAETEDETTEKATRSTRAKKMNIYEIINEIRKEAGAIGLESQGGVPFAFRGVNQVVNHLAPLMQKHGVITVPSVSDRTTSTRELGNGKAITQSDLLVSYTFYAPDGTSITATTNGLAQDFADRSAAQAQSVALRVALLQTFFLPTEDKEPEVAGEEVQKYIADAGNASNKTGNRAMDAAKSNAQLDMRLADARSAVKAFADEAGIAGKDYMALGNKVHAGDDNWLNSAAKVEKLLEALKNGETV